MKHSDRKQFFDIEGNVHIPEEDERILFRPSVYGKIYSGNGKILFIKDAKSGKWELPGGGVEPKETLNESVIREVKEETGYEIRLTHDQPVWVETRLSYFSGKRRFTHQIEFVFLGSLTGEQSGNSGFSEEEILEVGWFGEEELKDIDIVWYHRKYLLGETAKSF